MEKIGAWGLTEPDHGSDSVMLETTARRDGEEWVLNGKKRWIGNATFADIVIIWARDVEDGQVKGFVLEKDENGEHHPGYTTELIKGKMGKRAVWQPDIFLEDVRVPRPTSSSSPTPSRTRTRCSRRRGAGSRGRPSGTPSPPTRRRSSTPRSGCSSASP
jgi:glutaryl-CoA dehydrogenase